jgi:hypothetical protein
MLIKDSRLANNSDYHIKPLDLISIHLDLNNPPVFIVIPMPLHDTIQMVNMSTGEMYEHDVFNHPIHLHNHLMKHYGEYELVKSKNVEMHLTGPVQHIKKGGRW